MQGEGFGQATAVHRFADGWFLVGKRAAWWKPRQYPGYLGILWDSNLKHMEIIMCRTFQWIGFVGKSSPKHTETMAPLPPN